MLNSVKTDSELKKTIKINVDNTNNINLVFITPLKQDADNIRLAEIIEQELKTIFKNNPHKQYNLIANVLLLDKWSYHLPFAAQKIYLRVSHLSQLDKSVIVGNEHAKNFQTQFILWLIKMNPKINWFNNIETANEWLENNNNNN